MSRAGYPAAGEMIGVFRVGNRLGVGGMGVVFEALDTRLNRQVALKVISPHLADDHDFRARFTREAQAQASLDSPHVVHVYAHGEEDGRLYIATQLIAEGDLGAMLQARGAPPPPVGVEIIAQVADGLSDAHDAGLVHRDIKPSNVLLRRRGDSYGAYLADFGIARRVGVEATTTAGTAGTPSYMAPELHTGGEPGVASDVYSLGCLLWATLSGHAPYSGTSDYEIVSAHLEQPVPQLAPTSAMAVELNRVLRSAMAKDPAARHASAARLRDDLRRALALPSVPVPAADPVDPLTADPAPVVAAPAPRAVRRGTAAVVALAVLLVGGGLVAIWALTRDEPSGGDSASSSPLSSSVSPSVSPSETPSVIPSETPTTPLPSVAGTDLGADEQTAVAGFAAGLETQGLSQEQSTCVATSLVREVGLDALVADGFFDEQLAFLNPDLGDKPEIKSALTSATVTCLT